MLNKRFTLSSEEEAKKIINGSGIPYYGLAIFFLKYFPRRNY